MILSFCSLDKEFWLLVVIDDEAIDGSPEIDDAFEDAALQTPESRLAAWQLTWRFDLMPLAKSFLPALLVLLSWCPLAHAERRIALVVGNSGYQHARLANPSNDAQLMADTLKSLGFTLVGDGAQIDLDKGKLDAAVQSFGKLIQSADVALFYFAGHEVQILGSNYLVPVNANVSREADVGFQMLDLSRCHPRRSATVEARGGQIQASYVSTDHQHVGLVLEAFSSADGTLWLIRYRFGRDRLSSNVRFASIPTVNSGLGDLSRCARLGHRKKGLPLTRRTPAPGRTRSLRMPDRIQAR
jgi:hypothetical protein